MAKTSKVNNKTTIIIAIALSVIMFIAGFYVRSVYESGQKNQANAVASEFVNSVLSGDLDQAYSLTSSSFQEAQTNEEFSGIMDGFKDGDKLETEPAILEGDGRYLQVQFVGNLNEAETLVPTAQFYTTLERDGTDWRVFSVNVN
ncbi:MAG: hypothetical protein M3P98_02955 [bacterium]|nr:hypothetical protein [bacterium]MDQ3159065.1 hypothetical protein [bacterium]